MAETATMYTTSPATVLSLRATTRDKVKDLVIKNGQLIFVHDVGQLAFDYNGKRTFYNQIVEIESEIERQNLENPINGKYYFVIEKAVLWRYFNGWTQLTTEPEEILFIGEEFPGLGQPKTLYVNKKEGNEHISIWDEDRYRIVSDKTQSITVDELMEMFEN